jgi:hypothetical protein
VTPGEKKEPMNQIIDSTFDLLLQLFTDISNQPTSEQLLALKLLLLKCFYSAINVRDSKKKKKNDIFKNKLTPVFSSLDYRPSFEFKLISLNG